ncbi:MAG TPA: poly(R)-hydroxyalkanoic acid synthase subunit PhaE [Thermodesulfovibrionales bacterium]|nr:poly(R)-hydroxyalkanoic acid synthase subunit PhaE [Thermodesulfovibrionales bacterium]
MERRTDYFDSWLRSQKEAMEAWAETAEKVRQDLLRQAVLNLTGTKREASEAMGRGLSDLSNAWLALTNRSANLSDWWAKGMDAWAVVARQWQQSFLHPTERQAASGEVPEAELPDLSKAWFTLLSPFIDGKNPDTVKETVVKLFGSSHLYMKLFEACLPFFMAVEEKSLDAHSTEELIDPRKYKEILDKLFGVGPESAREVAAKATKLLEAWGLTNGHRAPWAEAMEKAVKALPSVFEGRLDFIINSMNMLFSSFDAASYSMFPPSAVERDRERAELLLALCDGLSLYMAKVTEYQGVIYETGLKAMDSVIEACIEQSRQGLTMKGFDDFLSLWLDVSEKNYHSLFETEGFSKLHGELLNAATSIRTLSSRLTELHLAETPLVLRSEMDELYKIIHDLKKEVKALKKERTATRL